MLLLQLQTLLKKKSSLKSAGGNLIPVLQSTFETKAVGTNSNLPEGTGTDSSWLKHN